jgi:hypothetical protein
MSHTDYFSKRAPSRYPKQEIISDREYKQLHWVRQLELRPLRDRQPYRKPDIDFDNRTDNWEDPEGEQ